MKIETEGGRECKRDRKGNENKRTGYYFHHAFSLSFTARALFLLSFGFQIHLSIAHGQHTTKYQSNLIPWPIRVFYCVSAVGKGNK